MSFEVESENRQGSVTRPCPKATIARASLSNLPFKSFQTRLDLEPRLESCLGRQFFHRLPTFTLRLSPRWNRGSGLVTITRRKPTSERCNFDPRNLRAVHVRTR